MDYTEWLKRLRNDTATVFKELDDTQFGKIHAYIHQNSGTLDDAKDIFQEALIVFYKKAMSPEFELTANPGTYLYSIARNMWLRHIKKKKPILSTDNKEYLLNQIPIENEIETKRIYDKKEALALNVFDKIDKKCQQLLEYIFFEKRSHEEIAQLMGYATKSVKVTKYRCLAGYRKLVGEHPNFNQLFE